MKEYTSLAPAEWPSPNHTMANQVPSNSVWSAMDYKPPRGRCNYKTSILSSCPCLRFMLHPVKAATSFDCDGCSHHASFHSLENVAEDAILKRWSNEQESTSSAGASKKRRRITEKQQDHIEILELTEEDVIIADTASFARSLEAKQRNTRPLRKKLQDFVEIPQLAEDGSGITTRPEYGPHGKSVRSQRLRMDQRLPA